MLKHIHKLQTANVTESLAALTTKDSFSLMIFGSLHISFHYRAVENSAILGRGATYNKNYKQKYPIRYPQIMKCIHHKSERIE